MKKLLSALVAVALVATLCSVFASAEDTNVALNKTYTTKGILLQTETQYGVYPDEDGKTLTDGVKANSSSFSFTDAYWVGFNTNSAEVKGLGEDGANADFEIVVNLGGAYEISKFALETMGGGLNGINYPGKIEFSYSTDGTTFTSAGAGSLPEEDAYNKTEESHVLFESVLELDTAVTANYVKVSFASYTGSTWYFVSEFEAYGAPASGDSGDESSSEAPVESTEAPVESTEAPAESSETESSVPSTGDAGIVAVAAVALVAIVGAAVVIRKRA